MLEVDPSFLWDHAAARYIDRGLNDSSVVYGREAWLLGGLPRGSTRHRAHVRYICSEACWRALGSLRLI